MQNTKTKILTALLLTAMTLSVIPLVNASVGPITVTPTTVAAGGVVQLDFTGVTFSGGQFYLLLSTDGFSQVSTGDMRYTPSFDVAVLRGGTPVTVTDPTGTFPGSWIVGNNLVVGNIPSNIAGGLYYIKAFDGAVTALAVTSISFTVTAAISVAPTTGGPGRSLTIQGNAFPANALVNITYFNPNTAAFVTVANLTQTGTIGNFTYVLPAPDIMGPAPQPIGDNAPVSNPIAFQVTENATAAVYTATYTEFQRGISQIGRPRAGAVAGNLQNATGLYGNLTRFDLAPTIPGTTVSVGVGDTLRIAGNFTYPGPLAIRWDNTIAVAQAGATVDATGYFNTTITVPGTGLGSHNITLVDANNVLFVVFVDVVPSILISPTSGPIGTSVTVNGFGFPSAGVPAGTAYNVTITFGTSTTVRAHALTDALGQFTATFNVPTAPGGANAVTATANDTAVTTAVASFNVQAAFSVTPMEFYANSSNTAVAATGTGFDIAKRFYVAIDNVFSPFSNTTDGIAPGQSGTSLGRVTFTFVGVGFEPGLHVVSLYEVGGTNVPVANATFTVLSSVNDTENTLLTAINRTVTQTNATVNQISGTLVSISNGFATIQTSFGTLTTSLQSVSATISGVSGSIASISSDVGSLQTSLSSINTRVTSVDNGIATIQTDLGTLQGTVTTVSNGIATIETDLGTLQADVSQVQDDVVAIPNQVNIPIWIAVVLALIAALAAIASLLLVRRKIAG